jgi:hypothetical protein
MRPLVSDLKMRRALPVPRASSGSFEAPNSRMMTRTIRVISVGPMLMAASKGCGVVV